MPLCKNCGARVGKRDEKCPGCGKNPRKRKTKRDKLFVLSKITVLLICLPIIALTLGSSSLENIGKEFKNPDEMSYIVWVLAIILMGIFAWYAHKKGWDQDFIDYFTED